MKRINNIFALLIIAAISSCYGDKNTSEYSEISKMKIERIEKTYTRLLKIDVLSIEPDVTSTNKTDKFEYLWTMYPQINNEDRDATVIDTIGTDINLEYEVNSSTGTYTINYRVTNVSNGLELFKSTTLKVNTKFSEGFYALKNLNDNTEMDFYSGDTVLNNLFTKFTGKPLSGKPVSMGQYYNYSYINPETALKEGKKFLNPISENELMMLRIDDMIKIKDYSGMFFGEAPQEKPMFFYHGLFYVGYVSDKGLHTNYQAAEELMMSSGLFAPLPDNVSDDPDTPYEIAMSAVVSESFTLFFDKKNGRFISTDFNATTSLINDSKSQFKANNIPHDFLFLGNSFISDAAHEGYAIFDSKDKSKRYIYVLNLRNLSNNTDPTAADLVVDIVEVGATQKIKNATMFAVNRNTAHTIYFNTNNAIYQYLPAEKKEQLLTLSGLDASGEITYFDTMFFNGSTNKDKNISYFIIATYKDGKYTVNLYDMVGGIPTGAPKHQFGGDGKIHTVQYVNPEMINKIDKRNSTFSTNY